MKKLLILLFAIFVGTSYAATETINWYVDGQTYDTTTCQSGGDVNLPTTPTKRGHRFIGWDNALFDFSTLDYTVAQTTGWASYNAKNQTWYIPFSYGKIYGESLCSVTRLSGDNPGTPDETTPGEQCWCRVTGYTPTGGNVLYEPISPLPWVSNYGYGYTITSTETCLPRCAASCSYYAEAVSEYRQKLFGITQ